MIVMDFGGQKIKGDVKIEGYKDWIEVHSFQFGVGRGIASSSGGSDRETSVPSIAEITVSKASDKASVDLFIEAARGQKGVKVVLSFINVGGDSVKKYMEFTLENTLISSYAISSGGDRPSESLALNFTKIEMAYWTWDGDSVTEISPKSIDLTTLS